MTVSDEAVEAAARVRFGASGWATAPEWWKEFERRTLRTTLEVAAPFIRAEALNSAAKFVEDCIKAGADDDISADETMRWLRARAAAERGGDAAT